MQRGAAILFAIVLGLGSLAQLPIGLFALTFCDENCQPDRNPSDSLVAFVVVAGTAVMVTSLMFCLFVALNKAKAATISYCVQLVLAGSLLAVWLDQSVGSDDTVVSLAVGFELFGVIALLLCWAESAQRKSIPSDQGA